jgi:AcrR family transcriptional regulator
MSPRTKEQNQQIRRERQAQILNAARQVFAGQGFHAARMSDIAQAAGVSQGTLYHYFRSKDDLFMGLLFPWAERLAEAVRGLPESPSSATDKMWAMSRLATAFFQTDEELMPVLVEFWAYALHSPKATESFRDLFQAMQDSYAAIIEEGVANGEFKPVDVQTISALPLAVLDGVIVLASLLDRNLVQPGQIVEQTQRLVFDGLLVKQRDGQ